MPRWKAVFVSVPKAACTTLKWLVADLQEEDRERFYRSISQEVGREMCIHRREMWRKTPMLHQLSDAELEPIAPENGWFIFSVVRHPSARLWSGWQSKFLLQEPRWRTQYGSEDWYPRVPGSTDEVIADFQRFAVSLVERPDQEILRDRHFWPQHRLVTPETTPYTKVYETREIPRLVEDFDAHLRRQGWSGKLQLRPSNETPLRPLARAFSPEVADVITTVYGEDFSVFGYDGVIPDGLHPGDAYPDSQLAEVGRLVDRAERIGDLAARAQGLARREAERKRAPRRFVTIDRKASPLRPLVRRVRRKLSARPPARD